MTTHMAVAEQMNRVETIYHVLKVRTGKTAACGFVADEDADRVDVTTVPRMVRCGSVECQKVFQIPERAALKENAGLLDAIVEGDAYLEALERDGQAASTEEGPDGNDQP